MSFKSINSFEKRRSDFLIVYKKYPTRIPIIIERSLKSNINQIDRNKFLVPCDQTIGQLIYVLRKRININHNEGIFIFVNNILPGTGDSLQKIYDEHKDIDGYLYLVYSSENTFGNIKNL